MFVGNTQGVIIYTWASAEHVEEVFYLIMSIYVATTGQDNGHRCIAIITVLVTGER